ncbi:hypothetical protein [Acinetobacter sp. NEB 394]|uniref:hypothetical protein n=1 Tax=Acinetobacter sp. NEB 394 TaxID=2743575 RepID=UPI0015969DE4|nr:hypothetical protein [Acinetobacter sp. NEB 394]QKY90858.1 hypothetical protein HUK62_10365 [Acinetobacter sp. NEB 394]
MKANEFFKKVGIEAVRSYVAAYEDALTGDLKRLVESHELVEKYKRGRGIRFRVRWGMYRYGDTQEFNDRLKQAIADVESCMEVSSESN